MSSKKRVVKNAFLYTFSNFLIRAFNFFLLPLYTSFLTTADYGTTNLIKNFISVMSIVCVFSSYAAVARFYADYKEDKEKTKKLFGTLLTFTMISGAFFAILLCIFKTVVVKYFFKGIPFFPTIFISVIGITFGCLYNMYQYILKGTEDAKKSTVTSICYFFIMLGLNIIFVVFMKLGANGVVLATLLTNLICSIYMLYSLIKNKFVKLGIDFKILKEILKYSIPLIPHDLATTISSLFSSIFINDSYNLSSLGLYSLACQFGDITDTVQSSVNTAFQPWFYSKMNAKDNDNNKEISELTYGLVWIYGAFFIGIAFFSQDVIMLFLNNSYTLAWKIVPLIVVSYSIKTMYYFYVNIMFYYREASKYIFIATLTSSILNVILSAILIPPFSYYGSIMADIITMILRVVIVIIISKRFNEIGYKISRFIRIIFIEILFIFVGLIFSYTIYDEIFSFKNFIYKCLIYLIFLFFILFSQRNLINNLFKNMKRGER
ncbi:oligosaccharide flippase family protein [Clostridium perfringens]|nr:oligosaccharide flippase family protein [Clostridium perfringens]MDM0809577.1 oligosaccharide flippase family protein [Clostridium perfringens]